MKKNLTGPILTLIMVLFFSVGVFSQSTEFTYQGQLLNASVPATGNFDFEFLLFDSLTGGVQQGATLTRSTVAVSAGTFAVKLDFGGQFPGANRFLQIHVRPTGGGAFTPLSPRQPVTSAPYAVKSLTADTATNATQLGGLSATGFVQNGTSQQAASNFNISGTGTADILNAATQYNIGGSRILSNPGTNNLFAGIGPTGSTFPGSNNSFFGAAAGGFNPGANNSFFGAAAGSNNRSGVDNAMFGFNADVPDAASFFPSRNSLFGSGTRGASTSTELTLIGFSASTLPIGPLNNATAIGARSQVTASNSLILGSINGINGATADTKVGIGTTAPTFKLEIIDPSNTGLRVQTNLMGGTVASFGGAGAFQIDAPGGPGGRFTVRENGNVGIGNPNPADKLNVNGNVSFFLAAAGTTNVCQNASFQISTCGSSIRYKQNINPFISGLSLIKQLRPVSFDWKDSGMADMGLVAEEVAAIEPLLTTYNAKGEIEGVKYDRIGVVLVNAVQEQQRQIDAQQKQIDAQNEIIKKQRADLDALKALVCLQNGEAAVCKPIN